VLLEDCLRGRFGRIVRAKGILPVGGEMLRFDLADRQYAVTGSPDGKTQLVFIGTALDMEALCRRLGTSPAKAGLRLLSSPSSPRRMRVPSSVPQLNQGSGDQK
jgi:hypothetical protein